jgi:hypothetical protein
MRLVGLSQKAFNKKASDFRQGMVDLLQPDVKTIGVSEY